MARNIIIALLACVVLFLLYIQKEERNQLRSFIENKVENSLDAARKVGEGQEDDAVVNGITSLPESDVREDQTTEVQPQTPSDEGIIEPLETPKKSELGSSISSTLKPKGKAREEFDSILQELDDAAGYLKGEHKITVRQQETPNDSKESTNDKGKSLGMPAPGGARPGVVLETPSLRVKKGVISNLHPLGRKTVAWAKTVGVDPSLALALVEVESNFQPNAVSPKGACGLAQVMPRTAAAYGVGRAELFSPDTNLRVGLTYLKGMLDQFGGRHDLALAAYNAGPGAVVNAGYRVPPYNETRIYVGKVLNAIARHNKNA